MVGWLGVALRRAAHDAALIVAAALVVLVAAGVLVAAAIYPDAIVRAGIARTLAAADPVASGIAVTIDVRQSDAATFDATVRDVVAAALGPASGDIRLTGQSEAYGLASGDAQSAATRFAFAEGIESHAHLLRGRWATDTGAPTIAGPPAEMEATLGEPAALALQVDAGSEFDVTSRLDPHVRFTVRVVGIFAVDDPADAFWGGDGFLLSGTEQRGPFLTIGPLFIGRDALLSRTIVTRVSLAWRAVPAFGRFAPENLSAIGGNVGALPDRLAGRLGRGQAIVVRTELPRLLGAVSSGLTQAGSGSTLVAGQMVVLAMYALIFVAALVVGQRRATTSLIRARGASSRHLIGLALIEALVIAAPAAALGLPLGLWLAAFLAAAGPSVAATSAAVAPAVVGLSQPVIGLAGVAGLVAIVGLALPTVLAVGPLARVHRSPGRQRAAALLQRSRIDLALAGLGVIALWRLRGSTGAAEVTATPLAAAGPAIGLLAGAILLLRIVPVIGRLMEGGLVRGGSVAGALSVRSVARRSAAYGRPALLFAMSAAIGLFAVGYGRTWEASQRDQAAQAVGADIRGQVGSGTAPGDTTTGAAYRAIPGVTAATPVAHEDFATGSSLEHGMLLAVVPEAMRSVAAFRPDLGSRPFGDLMAGLAAARPTLPLIALPTGTRRVRVRPDLRLTPAAGAAHLPAGWAGLSVGLVVRDAVGLIHRVTSAPALGTPEDAFVIPIPDPGTDPGSQASGIVAVELHLALPGGQVLTGSVGIRTIETSAAETAADWTPIDAGTTFGAWTILRSAFDVRPTPLPSGPGTVPGDLIGATIPAEAPLTGPGTQTIAARPTALTEIAAAPLAALVDPTLLIATGAATGDVVLIRHASSVTRKIRAGDTVTSFPGLAVSGIAIVDLGTFQLAGYATDETIPAPDEWWLAVAPGSDRQVMAALAIGPNALQGLHSKAIETESRINDPIALAISGMLILAAAAAAAFAAIGFAAAAWASTQSRLAEFAVARALGLTRRQVSGWLLLEQAFPTLIGVGWGIVLGVALEWLVLPAVTLAPGGGPAVPAALIALPLDLIAGYLGIAAALIAGTAVVLSRVVERAGMTDPLRGES
jgi:FtsX-like permease family